VGKDTAAKILMGDCRIKWPKTNTQRTAFATKLKVIAQDLYKWAGVRDGCYYDNFPEERNKIIPALGITVVDLWINIGNDLRRSDPNIWVNHVLQNHQSDILIISDLRYPNEAEHIQKLGGKCIKIIRDAAPKRDSVADNALEGWDKWDKVIINNDDLPTYAKQVSSLVELL
jgi:hypothetical protein